MSPDLATIIGNISTALILLLTIVLYFIAQIQQRAAQTREDLQAIIGDCNRFLRPLSQRYPYPIFHTVAAITKEICPRMGRSSQREDVEALLRNQELLLSVCVEGWIASSQVLHMMNVVEEVERKASSHNLQGKLLLICHASFLLAGVVAKACSPEAFYEMLYQLELSNNGKNEVEDALNAITIELQQAMCRRFDRDFRDIIKRSLYFIQTAARVFINQADLKLILMQLAKNLAVHTPLFPKTDPGKDTDPISKIEEEASLLNRFRQVKRLLDDLELDMHKSDYNDLCNLIKPIGETLVEWEASNGAEGERAMASASALPVGDDRNLHSFL